MSERENIETISIVHADQWKRIAARDGQASLPFPSPHNQTLLATLGSTEQQETHLAPCSSSTSDANLKTSTRCYCCRTKRARIILTLSIIGLIIATILSIVLPLELSNVFPQSNGPSHARWDFRFSRKFKRHEYRELLWLSARSCSVQSVVVRCLLGSSENLRTATMHSGTFSN